MVGRTPGGHLTSNWLGRLLRRAGLRYKRTGRSLAHKQKAQDVAAKRAALEALEKKGRRADRPGACG